MSGRSARNGGSAMNELSRSCLSHASRARSTSHELSTGIFCERRKVGVLRSRRCGNTAVDGIPSPFPCMLRMPGAVSISAVGPQLVDADVTRTLGRCRAHHRASTCAGCARVWRPRRRGCPAGSSCTGLCTSAL